MMPQKVGDKAIQNKPNVELTREHNTQIQC